MSLLPEIKAQYQHFAPEDYRPVGKAKEGLRATLLEVAEGDPTAIYTEKHLVGHGHKDTFGVLTPNGPDAYTLKVVTESGRPVATAALESGNTLFDTWMPATPASPARR